MSACATLLRAATNGAVALKTIRVLLKNAISVRAMVWLQPTCRGWGWWPPAMQWHV